MICEENELAFENEDRKKLMAVPKMRLEHKKKLPSLSSRSMVPPEDKNTTKAVDIEKEVTAAFGHSLQMPSVTETTK